MWTNPQAGSTEHCIPFDSQLSQWSWKQCGAASNRCTLYFARTINVELFVPRSIACTWNTLFLFLFVSRSVTRSSDKLQKLKRTYERSDNRNRLIDRIHAVNDANEKFGAHSKYECTNEANATASSSAPESTFPSSTITTYRSHSVSYATNRIFRGWRQPRHKYQLCANQNVCGIRKTADIVISDMAPATTPTTDSEKRKNKQTTCWLYVINSNKSARSCAALESFLIGCHTPVYFPFYHYLDI